MFRFFRESVFNTGALAFSRDFRWQASKLMGPSLSSCARDSRWLELDSLPFPSDSLESRVLRVLRVDSGTT